MGFLQSRGGTAFGRQVQYCLQVDYDIKKSNLMFQIGLFFLSIFSIVRQIIEYKKGINFYFSFIHNQIDRSLSRSGTTNKM